MTDEVAGMENDGLEFGGLRNEGLKIFQFYKCQSPFPYHGLRGSASPVLTATGLVNGRWQFSAPYRIDTP